MLNSGGILMVINPDLVDAVFDSQFGGVPREITPGNIKGLVIRLNDLVYTKSRKNLRRGEVKDALIRYIDFKGYEKELVRDYQRLGRPQWVYKLKSG